MGHIPGPKRDRLYEKKGFVEAIAILPPLVTAAVGAAVNVRDPARRTLGVWLAAATVWLLAASVIKVLHALAQDRDRKRTQDYDGLAAALEVLHSTVRGRTGLGPHGDGMLRVTIHRVVPARKKGRAPQELEQLLPYVGARSPGGKGRTFSIRSGIIGRAVREKAAIAATRVSEDYEAFLGELIRDYAYTEEDARALSPDRRSWMAVPILGNRDAPIAVVYLDSALPEFFTAEVQQLVMDACRGIAVYTREAY